MKNRRLLVIIVLLLSAMLIGYLSSETRKVNDRDVSLDTRASMVENAVGVTLENFVLDRQLGEGEVNGAIASFLGSSLLSPIYDVAIYSIEFEVTLDDEESKMMIGKVFVPQGESNTFPLLVYGAGTTGIDDRCAPTREDSNNPTLGNYENQMIAMASQGLLVLLPNYLGFDDDSIHFYYNKQSEAISLLSSIKVLEEAKNSYQELPNWERLYLGGYSQGGHAAFSAADLQDQLFPGLEISGIIGHGPVTDTMVLLERNPNLAPYFVYSYSQYFPEFEETLILQEDQLYLLDQTQDLCADEGFSYGSVTAEEKYTDGFYDVLINNEVSEEYISIVSILEENNAGTEFSDIPVFIAQGIGDTIVLKEDQDLLVEHLRSRGVLVEYKLYPDTHHFYTRQVSFSDTLNWIRSHQS